MPHGNSRNNTKPHHLYAIYDKQKDGLFKYGISHNTVDADGLSDRMRNQINFLNLAVDWQRYFGVILIRNIPNRTLALEIEDQHIKAYEEKFGQKPKGNLR